ncbi:MAG: N-acetyltransferase [Chloroflexi bacterium]|nr:MAG: N-acetyltransferase [Chloroflexota bacterium]MBL1195719.1 N-acetyltransferase [Chloroflexota bacterium]NOH13007.1 GNAT family N-acetyltransferase [Chloroflexota bacterium]
MAETTMGALPKTIQIEEANWRDFNAVRQLEQRCFDKDAWPWWDMLSVLTLPNIVRLKATLGTEIVGFVMGDVRPEQRRAWVSTICVDPDFRRQGIGDRLLDEVEGRVNVPRMRLSVRKSNENAIALYERRGYQPVGQWPRYYRGGEDALIMEKALT